MKEELPEIVTPRLVLRPFVDGDAGRVQCLAGTAEVSEMVTHIPHPYPDGLAEDWIASHEPMYKQRRRLTLAIQEQETGVLIGAVTLHLYLQHSRAEVGYWLGPPHWGQGYCTEAASAIVDYGRRAFALSRFHGRCLSQNKASARVLQKLGMMQEGCLVSHEFKDGKYMDILIFGTNNRT